ncbi:MAG: molybdopterin-guanine dinucleotide biosynthesis protein B [Desulfobulbaceae bacterium]|nr:molybdopterin-guanine dinucleotide biosynthesis protein B [Desulfobulbaceae bacterium]
MVPIVSFIGWHDSGKTSIVSQVVTHLKDKGLRVAVIKSTKHTDIVFDQPGSDTDTYRKTGADAVTLMAPDQMVMFAANPDLNLVALVHRFFHDYDIVIGEGFKHERKIAKIEVTRGDAVLLRDQVNGVIATITDRQLSGDYIFRLDESKEIAEFIIKKYIEGSRAKEEMATLLVNGKKVPMKGFVQDALAGTVQGFVKTLKQTGEINEIDLKIKIIGQGSS